MSLNFDFHAFRGPITTGNLSVDCMFSQFVIVLNVSKMFTVLQIKLTIRVLPTQKFCGFKLLFFWNMFEIFQLENVIFACCPVCPLLYIYIYVTRNHRILELEDVLNVILWFYTWRVQKPKEARGLTQGHSSNWQLELWPLTGALKINAHVFNLKMFRLLENILLQI